jgi:hypothetical protein
MRFLVIGVVLSKEIRIGKMVSRNGSQLYAHGRASDSFDVECVNKNNIH